MLEVALGESPDGSWSAFEVALIVARQNGKGAILEARELAGLYLFGEELILHSAHEFKTAAEAFRRILALIQSTPDLERKVMKVRTSHGDEGVELRGGQRLRFVARSTGSGRGFSGDCVILDEAYNLNDRGMAALLPTMSARPNPQLWYTSSAPLATDESEVLRRLCKRGREGSSSLAFMEFCAADDADLDDEDAWRQANPAFGQRVSAEFIVKERAALTDDDFARERLGIWHDPADLSNQVISSEKWHEAMSNDSEIDGRPVFALEVAEDRSWSAFGAAGRSTVGDYIHGERVAYQEGTAWVVARAVALKEKWHSQLVVAKGSPAASMLKELQKAGLSLSSPADPSSDDLVMLSTEEHARACGELYDRVMNGVFVHRDQPALTVALRGAVKRYYGDDAWIWSRRRSSVDIAPLVAVTLAVGFFDLTPRTPEPASAIGPVTVHGDLFRPTERLKI